MGCKVEMLPNRIYLYANKLKRINLTCAKSTNEKICRAKISVASYECENGYIFENQKGKKN